MGPVPLLNLLPQYGKIRDEVLAAIIRVADSQQFILGQEVKLLEAEIAAYSQAAFGIGCASGSDALLLALMAAGIGPGNEVLTSPYSFFATVSAIHRTGATTVFADIDPVSFNLDPQPLAAILDSRPKVRAIIPIHLFGGCADMGAIRAACAGREIFLLEDAAQAIGAEYEGSRAGSMGHAGCFSFFPSKNLGAFGDAGMITTQDPDLAARLSTLRVHGSRDKYFHETVGLNSRLDALQAAVLRVKFRYLDEWTAARQRNAARYRELLAGLPVTVPAPRPWQNRHIYNQFVIATDRRDQLKAWLGARGIGTEIYYPLPLHLQQCFAYLGYRPGDFPVSERLARESLAIPVHGELSSEELEWVADSIGAFFESL